MKTRFLIFLMASLLCKFGAMAAADTNPVISGTLPSPVPNNGILLQGDDSLKIGVSPTSKFIFHTDKGDIILNCRTGSVELSKGMQFDQAAVDFWKAVARAFPEAKRQIVEGEAKPQP
jgi:hypothetical protein